MKFTLLIKLCLVTVLLAAMTAGCMARSMTMDATTVSEYDQALSRFAGQDAQIEQGLERFAAAFSDLTAPDLAERFQALYASEIYFNDTLHVFHERDALVDYMRRTGASLTESHVEIKQVIQDEADVYVRWVMEFKTRAAGRDVHSHSIGMTHLRFDENGQVVLHQDFWDSGHALYAHLPFVGFAIRQARNRME